MTIGEAHAVNQILLFVLNGDHRQAAGIGLSKDTFQELSKAGALLAGKAHKALLAGISEQEWRKRFGKWGEGL